MILPQLSRKCVATVTDAKQEHSLKHLNTCHDLTDTCSLEGQRGLQSIENSDPEQHVKAPVHSVEGTSGARDGTSNRGDMSRGLCLVAKLRGSSLCPGQC